MRLIACLALSLAFVYGALAGDLPQYTKGSSGTLTGGSVDLAKAARDTFFLMGPWGSGATFNGQFQDNFGAPAALNDPTDPNSWTTIDLTIRTEPIWHADTYNVVNGTYSAWCGEMIYAPCTDEDPEGGYNNGYNEMLDWIAVVGNPNQSTTITVTATINHNSEPGYDYTQLTCYKAEMPEEIIYAQDGVGVGVAINEVITYGAGDYLGAGGNEVRVQWHAISDGGWSDSDCLYYGNGLCQIDDVTVTMVNDGVTTTTFDNFEDGTLGTNWIVAFPVGVGDFAQVWTGLEDIDPCARNESALVAFIDDGSLLPTGGMPCINWCYGPGGYIVNTLGGMAGPESHLWVGIESPVMAWPGTQYDGCIYEFDAYMHEDLSDDSPGMFYTWGIRSVVDPDPAAIQTANWRDRNFVYYGGPNWGIGGDVSVTDLIEPGRNWVQVQLTCYELGYIWGWDGDDGTPAPYFDNVRVKVFPFTGPGMSTREIDIANDNFPANGTIDMSNPGALSVRFDSAMNISQAEHLRNDPGDSIVFDVVPVRSGAFLEPGSIRIHYALNANPVFDAYRTSGLPNTGSVEGVVAYSNGIPSPSKWAFDLPDTAFLFPGDVLHYYIEAADNANGDIQYARMPADITGFGDFSGALSYNTSYVVAALPTLAADGTTPPILFWNDFGGRGGEEEWHFALANLGMLPGRDYDTYYTNGPSSGVGNGLGGRATVAQLAGYDEMLYTAGDLGVNTISNGDFENDASDDVNTVDGWLRLSEDATLYPNGKDMFVTGDDLVYDLANNAGRDALKFMEDWISVRLVSNDIRPLINNQATPLILAQAGNAVFQTVDSWIAYGGCFVINIFDAVEPVGAAVRLAQFADPNGVAGAYSYSAATLNIVGNTRVVSMPYDLMYVWTDPSTAKAPAGIPARAEVLGNVLNYFGQEANLIDVTGVPEAKIQFAASNHPNPFNPSTVIKFSAPTGGPATVKIFDVAGRLVKTAFVGTAIAGDNFVTWNGDNDQGSQVASGVYFYETRTGGKVLVNKMALVK